VVDLAAVCAAAGDVALLDLGWAVLLLPLLVTLVVLGPPGSGKSTLASVVALVLAGVHGVPVLYYSVEEGSAPGALRRFRRAARALGCPVPPGVALSDARDTAEADADLRRFEHALDGRTGFVIVDSLSDLEADEAWWRRLLTTGHGVLLVQHTVTSGQPRSGLEPAFAVDVVIHVESGGRAVPVKSRWSRTGDEAAFDVHAPRLPRGATP